MSDLAWLPCAELEEMFKHVIVKFGRFVCHNITYQLNALVIAEF
jgi:hypothetical protein